MKNLILKYFEMKTYKVDRVMFMNLIRMESILKRLFFLSLVLVAFTSIASAQTTANVSTTIQVTIKQALSITESGILDFGTAYPGYSVNPVDPLTASPSNIPVFTIGGEPDAQISITWADSLHLTHSSNYVNFAPTVAGNSTNSQSGASTFSSGTHNQTLSGVGSGNIGNYYLFLGGHLNDDNALPALPSGTYSGQFTINIAY